MRDVLAHDSRRVRLLALLGIAAVLLVARAEDASAALAHGGGAQATATDAGEDTSRHVLCRGGSNLGPCFYVAVEVKGNGRVESDADPAGTKVVCPPQGEHSCNVPEWFIWALDVPDPYIDFNAIATGPGSFQNWTQPDSTANPCMPAKPGHPAVTGNRCRVYANDLDGVSYKICLTANFTGTGSIGGCDEGTEQPIGDPVVVKRAGSGAAGGLVQSTADRPAQKQINCGTTCSAVFEVGTTVTLFPNRVSGSTVTFAGWGGFGHPCSGKTGACHIVVSGQPIEAVANYSGEPPPPPPPAILNAVILSKPAKKTKSRTARFAWGAKRAGNFVNPFQSQCKLNKQAWKSCRPAKTYRKLKAGRSHTFRVRVKDAKRNVWDKTPAVWTWRIRR